jgi:hypothetical protein
MLGVSPYFCGRSFEIEECIGWYGENSERNERYNFRIIGDFGKHEGRDHRIYSYLE